MKVDIHVYQVVENSSDFIRISCFDSPNAVANLANSVWTPYVTSAHSHLTKARFWGQNTKRPDLKSEHAYRSPESLCQKKMLLTLRTY